jgi:allophanate hydrolase
LGLGSVELEDGSVVTGFICETYGTANALDISEHGGWRAYLAAQGRDPASHLQQG